MPDPRANVEQFARNLGLAQDLLVGGLADFDSELIRDPRLLVPMHLNVLVVNPEDADREWADVKLNPHAIPGYEDPDEPAPDGEQTQPGPFDVHTSREVGVHLHWTLPDGLTKGEQFSNVVDEAEPDEVAAPDDQDKGSKFHEQAGHEYHADVLVPEDTAFPLIPDRWLVIRIQPRVGTGRRTARAWVIESEQIDPTQRVTPLDIWTEDHDDTTDRWMTVLGKGDPAYVAYYDNVRDVVGFYDDLEGIATGPLTYVVAGWYSKKEDDPLFGPKTKQEWLEKLDFLGWSLGTDDEEAARLATLEERMRADRQTIGLQAQSPTSDQFSVVDKTTGLLAPAPQPAIAAITAQLEAKLGPGYLFARYWPKQILCHGAVYDVKWGTGGGTFDTPSSGPPQPGRVGIAVGNTSAEAIAALIADRRALPNLERLVTAFHHGLLPQIRQPDGLSVLESFLHAEDFQAKPGGFYTDLIEQGDIFPEQSPTDKGKITGVEGTLFEAYGPGLLKRDQTVKTPPGTKSVARQDKLQIVTEPGGAYQNVRQQGPGQSVLRKFVPLDFGKITDKNVAQLGEEVRRAQQPPVAEQLDEQRRRKVAVRRALPRFWEPRDPVILLTETRRSFAHGEDGRLADDDTLACRLSGETITSINIVVGRDRLGKWPARLTVGPYDLSSTVVPSGQIPHDAVKIYEEALLLDLTNATIGADSVTQRVAQGELGIIAPEDRFERTVLDKNTIVEKLQVEASLLWNSFRNPEIGAQGIASISGVEGTVPVPFSLRPWMRPWTPLHLDWEVEYIPSPNMQRDWVLDEHDFVPKDSVEESVGDTSGALYRGRSLLTPAASRVLANQLSKFIEQESNETSDLASDAQETALGHVRAALRNMDVLATSLAGFHEMLLGLESKHAFFGVDDPIPTIEEPLTSNPDLPLFPLRAGHMKIRRLRIVDSFGQFYDLSDENLAAPSRPEDMRTNVNSSLLRLPPRVVQPTRLMFRMLSASADDAEATKLNTPVCGWIVPDHLDQALEVYDAGGGSLGQVQLRIDDRGTLSGGLEWQGVPGRPEPFGGPPRVNNPHARRFVEGLLAHGERDRLEGVGTPERSESALTAFLRMIDATLWSVDPLGREGDEHLSVLIGRPLALVRAKLHLELDGVPATEELKRSELPVRLGALTHLHDGLIGYFVNDDYDTFYPVHETIANETRQTRSHHGFLGAIHTVPDYYQQFANSPVPVVHPYVNEFPTVSIRPEQTVMLTLIIDPRGGVHATSGFLPRKRIDLMREHVANALERITLTFRVGPVLTDPETIRMPLPSEIKGGWSWVRRTGVTVWEESSIVDATQDAQLGPTPALITEGWLKLTSALGREETDES